MVSVLRMFRGLPLLGFLAFLLFLIATAPLHLLWPYVKPQLGKLPVEVRSVVGTVWQARVQIANPQTGVLDLDWKLQPLSLFSAHPAADIRVQSEQLNANLQLQVSPSGTVNLSNGDVFLDSALLTPMLRKNRTEISGTLEASQLNVSISSLKPLQIQAVSGRLVYSGGKASFPVNRNTVQADVPMLVAEMALDDKGNLQLPVTNTDREAVSQLFLKTDGWAGVKVYKRLLDLTGQPWNGKEGPDSIVFEVSQKIL